ncbi:putative antitoxin of toxin-antitoxin [Rickettsia peacockii str. Rustic]|uniref:Antitoxin of toxin-antitoxin n=1 Tax=Rickettsia peacockii (strain Rustic) TaxID=562019 RepID=C4K1J8_RICPU|nr:antitoxin of toxin-antitoxin (TA) system [Rickettsia peacockii]ACR47449.1 putative antitoxin of toxin-antitoxin [Rickettsia peacockii str. Rustic]
MAIFMTVITTRTSNELDIILSNVVKEIDRPKGYIIRKAIESYIEEKADLLIALSCVEKREEVISLEDIKKKYGLED